jgi:predicted DNA-binding ribbon-helix-helix protein
MAPTASTLPDRLAAPNEDPEKHSALVVRNVNVHGHRTSIRLEPQIWNILAEICRREFCTLHDICSYAAKRKAPHGSLASSLRVVVLDYFHTSATEAGHTHAGHGQGMFMSEQLERQEMRKAKANLIERLEGSERDPLRERPGIDPA